MPAHHIDELRQLVVPLLQQNVDVRSGLIDLMLDADEPVVDGNSVGDECKHDHHQRK
jgi:hypothetical protein